MTGKVVVHIAAGWDHSMAITNEGKVRNSFVSVMLANRSTALHLGLWNTGHAWTWVHVSSKRSVFGRWHLER